MTLSVLISKNICLATVMSKQIRSWRRSTLTGKNSGLYFSCNVREATKTQRRPLNLNRNDNYPLFSIELVSPSSIANAHRATSLHPSVCIPALHCFNERFSRLVWLTRFVIVIFWYLSFCSTKICRKISSYLAVQVIETLAMQVCDMTSDLFLVEVWKRLRL